MRTLKLILAAVLVAALSFLAAFIITVNLYSTSKAFEREAIPRSTAIHLGLLVAAVVGAVGFLVTLHLLASRRTGPK